MLRIGDGGQRVNIVYTVTETAISLEPATPSPGYPTTGEGYIKRSTQAQQFLVKHVIRGAMFKMLLLIQ